MASRNINYLNKDFDGFKSDLISYVKQYFPSDYKDFNETSTGMMMLELVAYVGDVLSFEMDRQFRESFLEQATEEQNLIDRAESLGLIVRGNTVSSGEIDIFCEVSSSRISEGSFSPLLTEAPIVVHNSIFSSEAGESYRLVESVDFSDTDDMQFAVFQTTDDGEPLSFGLKKKGKIEAGEIKTVEITVGPVGVEAINDQVVVPEEGRHLEIEVDDDDVVAIDDVRDSAGNRWHEVEYLAQDTIFKSVANENNDPNDSDLVPQVMKLCKVPRRFITRYDKNGNIRLIFGNGTEDLLTETFIPNPSDLAIPYKGRGSFSSSPINPENFTKTNTMGLFPSSTTLTIDYVKGGGKKSNAPAGSVNTITSLILSFPDSVSVASKNRINSTIAVINEERIVGGADAFDKDQIRLNAPKYFAAQSRGVTDGDIVVQTMTMPQKFGKVFRAYATNSNDHRATVHLYLLSLDENDKLIVPPKTMKQNVKEFLRKKRMLTDQIEILDGKILDVGVDFSIVTIPGENKKQILARALLALKEFFAVEKWQIGQAIVHSEIYGLLQSVEGVLAVSNINVINFVGKDDATGLDYSSDKIDIIDDTVTGITVPPPEGMFQVRYLDKDLRGSVL